VLVEDGLAQEIPLAVVDHLLEVLTETQEELLHSAEAAPLQVVVRMEDLLYMEVEEALELAEMEEQAFLVGEAELKMD
jgi:hypothetical protein